MNYFEWILLGFIGGLLGVFFRNCLKVEDMIFVFWYKILKKWYKRGEEMEDPILASKYSKIKVVFFRFRKFICMILGYCIYCTTTWITFLIYFLWLWYYEFEFHWIEIVLGTFTVMSIQHLIVCISTRWLIHNHPDLDPNYHKCFFTNEQNSSIL